MQQQSTAEFVESVRPLFKKRAMYRRFVVLVIIAVVICYMSETLLVIPAIALLLAILPGLVQQEVALEARVWQRFVEQLDAPSAPGDLPPERPVGVIGKLSDGRSSILAAGSYRGYSIRLFSQDISYAPTPKSSAIVRSYRILEITTKQHYYPVFLDSKSNSTRFASHIFSTPMNVLSLIVNKNRQLTVEGDVNKFFRIYVPSDARYQSLVTLSPEKLLALRDYGKTFDVEFVDNKILLITDTKIKGIRDVLFYQEAVFSLLKNIGVDITRERDDVVDELSVRTPNVLAS